MKTLSTLAAGLVLATTAGATHVEFSPLDQACEEALALSAIPASMRDRANVYVWRGDAFEKTITSDGGFHCLVQRNHPDAIIPECVSSTGQDSILKGIMTRTRLTADGIPDQEAQAKVQQMVADGDIAGPSAPGVNYMMSAYNRIYIANADQINFVPPHSMFFAPNAESDVIGGSFQEAIATKGFPFVVEAGAHSYIVTVTDKPSNSSDVMQACDGQIDTESPFHLETAGEAS